MKVYAIKAELDLVLEKYVKLWQDRRVVFSHAKCRYEIEVPEEHVKTEKPTEFELTS